MDLLHMAKQKQDDQLEHTYSSSVRIWDVALKTCHRWWMIGKSGERGSGISVLVARHDDKKYFSKIWSFAKAIPQNIKKIKIKIKKINKNKKFLQDDSLQIDFQWNQILSINHSPTNKFQHNRPLCFTTLTWFCIKWLNRLICHETKTKQKPYNSTQIICIR